MVMSNIRFRDDHWFIELYFLIISQQIPFFSISSAGLPNYIKYPPSMTIILSYLDKVESRWAIIRTVFSLNFYAITSWIKRSFFTSILAVASSIKTILVFLRTALQMQMSCFSPAERLLLLTFPSRPPLEAIISKILHYLIAFSSCSSEYSLKISKFYRNVEFRRTGSWSITVIDFLNCFNGISQSLYSSIKIQPQLISVISSRVLSIVDLPEPVRPTTPTFSPLLIMKLRLVITLGRSGRYRTETSRNYILPLWNTSTIFYYSYCHSSQYFVYFSSGGRFISWQSLSREISWVQNQVQSSTNWKSSSLKLRMQVRSRPMREGLMLGPNMQKPMLNMLIRYVRQTKTRMNQLVRPNRLYRTLLQLFTLQIQALINLSSHLQLRIRVAPLIPLVKPTTSGELVDFSSLISQFWEAMQTPLILTKIIATITTGIKVQGVDVQMLMTMADNILQAVVIEEQNVLDITSSISFRSLLKRFMILPSGTLLKNLLRLAQSKPLMMLLCTLFPCLTPVKVKIKACRKIKTFAEMVSPIKTQSSVLLLPLESLQIDMKIEAVVWKAAQLIKHPKTGNKKHAKPPFSIMYSLKILKSTTPFSLSSGSINVSTWFYYCQFFFSGISFLVGCSDKIQDYSITLQMIYFYSSICLLELDFFISSSLILDYIS